MARRSSRLSAGQVAVLLILCTGLLAAHPLAEGSALFGRANAPSPARGETHSGEPTDGGHHDEALWPAPKTAGGPDAQPQAVSAQVRRGASRCLTPPFPPPKTYEPL